MDSDTTKADVEARLRETAEEMSERMETLQDEISTSGASIRDWMVENPWKSVGGMLAAGLAVGWLFGGGGRSRRRRAHEELVEGYIDAIRDEVSDSVAAGEEPGQALERALRDRVPMVIFSDDGRRESGFVRNFLGEGIEIVLRTGLSLFARDALEAALADVNVEEMLNEELEE